ncbi:MAG: camphor resistance protein CrcB [Elusimicrobia bacterium RIFOXYA1_FULL_47_7]|nr:MAG: camphor resistance protein CrcB [Elusimicrobia bacterium RIFOXYA12_FULL_49_49]OGS06677.1 MAG: camphor resistance protein CrcB [Elusimicrobia bacterium RIFOXYA1_FULL_47_7]OGS09597.1 MAG: camphor resistance protein CrcB [Elusimicrobia bacterium RIFOXYB1_FULL_48_9]OGS16471.1 MAG: camphor resistance protein CrcB [Elusimicrobia bacterium RIFOXYA2_FULL_47_53]OGS26024.1 MAG: camphor resistance protein CrcB [Elusimicrobia bacterium RIFOXYB12_FULL_50_12]OGS29641.1 MAG: camphor resistance protei
MKYIYIALGGTIGALLRYGVSGLTYRYFDGVFPWGTLAVNLSGCFAIGFLWAISEQVILSAHFKPFVLVGIIGAYTTFSTFSLETFHLLRDKEIKMALVNVLASNILGIGLVFLGFVLANLIFKRG